MHLCDISKKNILKIKYAHVYKHMTENYTRNYKQGLTPEKEFTFYTTFCSV